ncbi:FAD-binding and (Fe-S)-binding domain-containing protein [uncultured Thiothrix sp.]|uniref:FAD-binding and (Fe-S)-binding domain-containing protein n=1 Tax=uncultured Thiothrix sp. TaxID=223185 RepID=UPI00262621BF|nr:FAD-binding and (Fe-S)-binding domain-containing protein [uncultured Thiothrix sp.]HMT91579.1 FAD-binding and (Fe-S)-binding domain-containing protein [Thiolinea sp.]
MSAAHQAFCQNLLQTLPAERVLDDEFHRLTYGTDASFYRLIPEVVVKVKDEDELQWVLRLAREHQVSVTFRAAGTSLSGQAVTDSVLVMLELNSWREFKVLDAGAKISLQPGIIGSQANQYLMPFGRKIGPDPATLNTCKIGGIAANNSSGMCCGTAQNSYHTLSGMRVVLANGTVIDTRTDAGRQTALNTQKPLLNELTKLATEVQANPELTAKIRHKYRLKNTTGYSINALVDYTDPLEILTHLMIGSEGTLGFISAVQYHTVPDYPHKATSLVLFPHVEAACLAVTALKPAPVDAVELIDGAGLRSVQGKAGMPANLADLNLDAAALLIDVRAPNAAELARKIAEVHTILSTQTLLFPAEFTQDPVRYAQLWGVRKGLFPAVGAVRPVGTTVIIEDVAFPIEQLAAGVRDLQAIFAKYHYSEALIFGHALEGNLHFVFTQDFSTPAEVDRYAGFMDDVAQLVAVKYGGSLKAEHGTGRNMAPFVELEWGQDAYQLMWKIKRLFDPENLLNPGVVLNEDPAIHLKNLKPMPATHELVDRCIECGFCEPVCPSRNLTLTPRQRIVAWREHARLKTSKNQVGLQAWDKAFAYQGLETCAIDGLCSTRCPVGINTGELVRALKTEQHGATAKKIASYAQTHIAPITQMTRFGLNAAAFKGKVLGNENFTRITQGFSKLTGDRSPIWHDAMPRGAKAAVPQAQGSNGQAVYFTACVTRSMGTAVSDSETRDLPEVMQSLMQKAGFAIITPKVVSSLCCGLPFASKGLPDQALESMTQLEAALWEASEQGKYPIVCDTSPCTLRLIECATKPMHFYETAGFIHKFLLPHLTLKPQDEPIALHITCSARKMGLDKILRELVKRCAPQVIEPEEEGCCGFGGDKGFMTPELNAAALARLKQQLPEGCHEGVSNSRTCEIGLTLHSGRQYRSVAYLVERCLG